MSATRPRVSDEALLDRIGRSRIEAGERRLKRRNFRVALAFMAPAVTLVGALLLAPMAYNVYLSLTKWKKFKGLDEFAGIENYSRLATNRLFGDALYNTSLWVAASIVFPLAIGFGLAVFLRGVAFEKTIKSIIFLPRILAPTAVGVIWFYVYAPDGVVNRLLTLLAGDTVDIGWLYRSETVTPAIIATFVWQTVGLVMVLILLGLSAIPKDPLEAAPRGRCLPRRDLPSHRPAPASPHPGGGHDPLRAGGVHRVRSAVDHGCQQSGAEDLVAGRLHVFRGVPEGFMGLRLGHRRGDRRRGAERDVDTGVVAASRR